MWCPWLLVLKPIISDLVRFSIGLMKSSSKCGLESTSIPRFLLLMGGESARQFTLWR